MSDNLIEKIDRNLKEKMLKTSSGNTWNLSSETSKQYVNQIMNFISSDESQQTHVNLLLLLYRLFKLSDSQVLINDLIGNENFWLHLFKLFGLNSADNDCVRITVEILQTSTNILLSSPDKFFPQLQTFSTCIHSSYSTFLDRFAIKILSYQEVPKLVLGIIKAMSNFISCMVELKRQGDSTVLTIISDTQLELRESGFLSSLSIILEENPDDELLKEKILDEFITPLKKIKIIMKTSKTADFPIKATEKLFHLIQQSFHLNEATKAKFLDSNYEYQEFSKFDILQVMDLVYLLKDDNLTIKKTFSEQLLFEDNIIPFIYALSKMSDLMYDILGIENLTDRPSLHICHYMFNKELILYALMERMLVFWSESHCSVSSDLESLLDLVYLIMDQVRIKCINSKNSGIELGLNMITNSSYHELRRLQLSKLKKRHYLTWSKYISEFDSMLSVQVYDYICHQRLLQLQKGSWVYSENMFDPEVKQPKVYFLVLSDNHMNLLAKEFKFKGEQLPTVEDNEIIVPISGDVQKSKTILIPLKHIAHYHSKEVRVESKDANASRLAVINNKKFCMEVSLSDKNHKPLLKFFLEDKSLSYVWLDGLQLIATSYSTKKHQIPETVKKQMDLLIDLRKNVQIMGLDNREINDHIATNLDLDDDDDDEYYNLETLQNLSLNLYYD